jgi:glycerol uptake facilitator-like aquaporin
MTSVAPTVEEPSLAQRFAAEALGTALLLATVVGSGIMAERLTHDLALALLCNTLATGAMLFVLILLFADVSGAHFNPAVTLVRLLSRAIPFRIAAGYGLAQIAGAIAGVWLAHAMFGEMLFAFGVKARSGFGQDLSEGVATFGLILTIAGTSARAREAVAAAVGLYILAAYWFTASTSFANPAVTLARALTPSFAGIRPLDAPAFIAAQFAGGLLAWIVAGFLFPNGERKAP